MNPILTPNIKSNIETDIEPNIELQYQPSGVGTNRSPPAMHATQKMATRGHQNSQHGLERGPILGNWALRSAFAK